MFSNIKSINSTIFNVSLMSFLFFEIFIHTLFIFVRYIPDKILYFLYIIHFYASFIHVLCINHASSNLHIGVFLALFSSLYGISPTYKDTFWGIFCFSEYLRGSFLFFRIFKGVRGRTYVRFYFPVPVLKRRISRFPVIRSLLLVGNAQNTIVSGRRGNTI